MAMPQFEAHYSKNNDFHIVWCKTTPAIDSGLILHGVVVPNDALFTKVSVILPWY